MKKIIIFAILAILALALSGCGKKTEPLKFSLSKNMIEAGVVVEGNENLELMEEQILSNPDVGEGGTISFVYSGMYGQTEEEYFMNFYLINRSNITLKNLSFVINADIEGEVIYDNVTLKFEEDFFGEVETNTAYPVTLNISEDKYALLETITTENFSLILSDMEAEAVYNR